MIEVIPHLFVVVAVWTLWLAVMIASIPAIIFFTKKIIADVRGWSVWPPKG